MQASIQTAEQFFNNNPLLVGAAVLIIGLLYYAYDQGVFDSEEIEPFESTTMEERSLQSIKARMKALGKDSGRDLWHGGTFKMGTVSRFIEVEMPTELMTYGEEDEDKSDDGTSTPVYVLEVTSSGRVNQVIDKIKASLSGGDSYKKYYVTRKDNIEMDDRGFILDDDTQFMDLGQSIMIEWSGATVNAGVVSIAMTDALYKSVNSFPDYSELQNYKNSQQSFRIQKMEKMNEMDMDELVDQMREH